MGEYVGRIFEQVKHRPLFIIDECVGIEPTRGFDQTT
jgi:hypothetical protein